MKSSGIKGVLLGGGSVCFWTTFYPSSRFLFGRDGAGFDPLFVTLLRFAAAALTLAPFLLPRFNGGIRISFSDLKKDWKMILFLSASGIVIQGLLLFYATKYTTAARTTMMAAVSPIFTAIFAYFSVKEEFTLRRTSGMILGFAGIVLVMSVRNGGDMFSSGGTMLFGDILALFSGVFWALFTAYGEKISNKYGGLASNAMFYIAGTAMMIPLVFLPGVRCTFDYPLRVWLWIIYVGAFPCGIAFGMWCAALKYLRPSALGAFGYVSPLAAMAVSALLLDEKITIEFIAASLVTLSGVALMMSGGKNAVPDR